MSAVATAASTPPISSIKVAYGSTGNPADVVIHFRDCTSRRVRGSVKLKLEFDEELSKTLFGDPKGRLVFDWAEFEMTFPFGCDVVAAGKDDDGAAGGGS